MLEAPMLRGLVDGLIVFTGVEVAGLALWHWRTGRGWPMSEIGPGLAAGLLLMIGIRCALTPGAEILLLACVAGSGLCHVADLRRRLR